MVLCTVSQASVTRLICGVLKAGQSPKVLYYIAMLFLHGLTTMVDYVPQHYQCRGCGKTSWYGQPGRRDKNNFYRSQDALEYMLGLALELAFGCGVLRCSGE